MNHPNGNRQRRGHPIPTNGRSYADKISRDLLGRSVAQGLLQQAKLDQAFNQNQRGSFMGMIEVIPRTAGVDGSTVRRQHNVIHVALSRTKNPAHGKGASNIRRIVLQLTAGIDQHQVPF